MKIFIEWVIPTVVMASITAALLILAGAMMDQQTEYSANLKRCLQHAHNGLDIDECKR